MIEVTRLNNEPFLLNADLIEFIEETPNTVISMQSGRRVIVCETSEEIKKLVIEYKKQLFAGLYPKV